LVRIFEHRARVMRELFGEAEAARAGACGAVA
jgi:hypothetical protein